jgi:hypothetical protein
MRSPGFINSVMVILSALEQSVLSVQTIHIQQTHHDPGNTPQFFGPTAQHALS